jgi:hypothetical protein
VTQPENKSSHEPKKQPKAQRAKFAEMKYQQLDTFVICFWANKRMTFIIIV